MTAATGDTVMKRRTFVLSGLALAAAGGLAGCVIDEPGYGPPPHAPAHGRRRRHPSGVELIYDPVLALYIVVGHPGIYYHDGVFFRHDHGTWYTSRRYDRDWRRTRSRRVPPGLRRRYGGGRRGRDDHQGDQDDDRRGRGRGRGRDDR